jgi:Protein of unknown function (DUF1571)
MKLSHAYAGRLSALVLVMGLSGCTEFAPTRMGSLRNSSDAEEGPPKAAVALRIPNAPSTAKPVVHGQVEQAGFVPEREVPAVDPSLLENPLRVLYQRAAQRHALMESYIFRLKRREVVNGRKQPEELVKVQLRREPYSVHLVWLGKEGKGREAIYVQGKYKNEMQLLLAGGDVPLIGAGMRYNISPDAAMAKAKSRHPITETGFGPLIESFGRLVVGIEKGDAKVGTAKYLGRVKREEFPAPVESVLQTVPAGSDPLLPKGGRRFWYFDVNSGLPVLYITHDTDGEVEYYCHDHVIWPAPMDDNDFDPDRVWRK